MAKVQKVLENEKNIEKSAVKCFYIKKVRIFAAIKWAQRSWACLNWNTQTKYKTTKVSINLIPKFLMSMKNLFKFLLLGAFTFSLAVGFVGCKNYDDDIDAICTEIDAMKEDIADIKAKLDGLVVGKYVANATQATPGGDVVITYSDGTTVTLKFGGSTALLPYVEENEDGSYTLFIAAEGDDEYTEILLPGAASAVSAINILGWYTAPGYKGADGFKMDELSGRAGTWNAKAVALNVKWAGVAAFLMEPVASNLGTDNGTPGTTGQLDKWDGGKIPVVKNMVLNTLSGERTGLIVEVEPATADITGLDLSLVNSKGGVLPIALGTPEAITGLATLTRDASKSAFYFIPGTYNTETYAAANTYKAYTDLYVTDAVYSLYANGTRFAGYTDFTSTATQITSVKESRAGALAETADLSKTLAGALIGSGKDVNLTQYNPVQGVAYSIAAFTPSSGAALLATTNNEAVVDYYLEVADKTDFETGKFGITIPNPDRTSFTVTRLPDDLTLATFRLNVYKLTVNGSVFFEQIVIRPVRSGESVTIPLGEYVITDEATYAGGAQTSAGTVGGNADSLRSARLVVPLTAMFEKLATIDAGSGTTMEQRWKNADYGATSYSIKAMSIGDKDLTDTEIDDLFTAFDGSSPTGAVGIFANTKADGTGTSVATSPYATGKMYQAQSLVIKMPYAIADADGVTTDNFPYIANGTSELDPAFSVGELYSVTIDFVDKDNDYLNTIVYTFTPVLPPLADLFKRENGNSEVGTRYWEGNTLNAYYRTPDAWANTYFFTAGIDGGATTSTYYNVFRPASSINHTAAAPSDGGFTKFGIAADTDKMWIDFPETNLALADDEQQIDGEDASTLVTASRAVTVVDGGVSPVTYEALKTTVELLGQTTSPLPAPTAPNAYGDVLNMRIVPGLYLGVYEYSDEEIEEQDFDMKIMSALFEGEIKETGDAITRPAGSIGAVLKLDDSHISGYNYAGQKYSLFQTGQDKNADKDIADAGETFYVYTYIQKVEFSVPAGDTTYTIVGADGNTASNTAVAPTLDGDGNLVPSYVNIKTSSLSPGNNKTGLVVKVYDRYGKVKEETIPFTIVL